MMIRKENYKKKMEKGEWKLQFLAKVLTIMPFSVRFTSAECKRHVVVLN